eukprot:4045596-Prorocentrum_lima.AAC.1
MEFNWVMMGDEGGCDSEEWKKWADCCEDEAFLSAMSLGGGDKGERLVEAMREQCRGDLHRRGCEKCKKAMGHMRVHKHGKSN